MKVKIYLKTFTVWIIAMFVMSFFINYLFYFPLEGWPLYRIANYAGLEVMYCIFFVISVYFGIYMWHRIYMTCIKEVASTIIESQKKIISQSKARRLHRLIFRLSFFGIVPIFILATITWHYFCPGLGGLGQNNSFDVGIWCSLIGFGFLTIMLWMMFLLLPIWITLILMWLSYLFENIWLKYICTLPIFYLFINFFIGIILVFDRTWIVLIVLSIFIFIKLWVYLADSGEKNEPLIFTPPSQENTNPLLADELSKIDVSDVDSIYFHENGWKSYKIKLDSIKSIAVYCFQKSGKMSFAPWELSGEWDFLLKNYQSKLSETDYNMLVNHLFNWIHLGWSFEIIKK